MSTRIGIITEGAVDRILLPPLLAAVAQQRAEYTWPVSDDDISRRIQIRGRGHGAVLNAARQLVEILDDPDGTDLDHAGFVILLDRKTRPVQAEVRALLGGRDRFVLGIAVEEIEAWWLADRTNTLRWAGLDGTSSSGLRYATNNYSAERDDDPKRTLHELTVESSRLPSEYGIGAVDLAREFVSEYWADHNAPVDLLCSACPVGFGAFVKDLENLFRRIKVQSTQKKKARRTKSLKQPGDK